MLCFFGGYYKFIGNFYNSRNRIAVLFISLSSPLEPREYHFSESVCRARVCLRECMCIRMRHISVSEPIQLWFYNLCLYPLNMCVRAFVFIRLIAGIRHTICAYGCVIHGLCLCVFHAHTRAPCVSMYSCICGNRFQCLCIKLKNVCPYDSRTKHTQTHTTIHLVLAPFSDYLLHTTRLTLFAFPLLHFDSMFGTWFGFVI